MPSPLSKQSTIPVASLPSALRQVSMKEEPRQVKARPQAAAAPLRWARGLLELAGLLFSPFRLERQDKLPIPAPPSELKIVSYNAMLGGQRYGALLDWLRAQKADAVCLQEISHENAQKLAAELGMHLAFYGGARVPSGKAVLSRFPIVEAENKLYDRSWASRWEAVKHALRDKSSLRFEPLEDRSLLRATLDLGKGRRVDLITTHLSLRDADANAEQLRQLRAYASGREEKGHGVVITGDFNSNLALRPGGRADAPGAMETPTDTLAEYADRYPGVGGGNIALAEPARRAEELLQRFQPAWGQGEQVVLAEGRSWTPEQARQALAQEPPGTPRAARLRAIMDGLTHLAAAKRFDNLLLSGGLRSLQSGVDQDSKASDHQPTWSVVQL